MNILTSAAGQGTIDGVDLREIAANYGTPAYVYSASALRSNCQTFLSQIAKLKQASVSYAVKANGSLALLQIIAEQKFNFDVGSHIELARVKAAYGTAKPTICFTGPGKSSLDLQVAIDHDATVICESEAELLRLEKLAIAAAKTVKVGIRLNPDIDAKTHRHIATGLKDSKFGLPSTDVIKLANYVLNAKHLQLTVLHSHIGSQITTSEPLIAAAQTLLDLRASLPTAATDYAIDLGGGFGITDQGEVDDTLEQTVSWLAKHANTTEFNFQPGRSVVANCGVLLCKVEYSKANNLIVDAAMNDLLRPALYEANHPLAKVGGGLATTGDKTVCGPVCESADKLATNIELDAKVGDLLAIGNAGAYGFVMASNYNGRARACELLLDSAKTHLIRRRETANDLMALENLLPTDE